jgi:hypothetical protein
MAISKETSVRHPPINAASAEGIRRIAFSLAFRVPVE